MAIQWLRALAAIEVMIWHSDLVTKQISSASIQSTFYKPLGGIGVEVFFIVSGFLMSFITIKGPGRSEFLSGRIRRIFPLYWIFTTFVIAAFLINADWHLANFELDGAKVINSYLLLPQRGFPILTVGWTLQYEVVFYAAVAAFTGLSMSGTTAVRMAFGAVLGFAALLGCAWPAAGEVNPWLNHLFTPYLFAFGFGWMIHMLRVARSAPVTYGFAVFALTFLAALAIAEGHDAELLKRIAIAATIVAVFLAILRSRGATSRSGRALARIGEASYSLYLSHWFVLSIIGKVIGMTSLPASADPFLRIAGLLVALVAGCALFYAVERPLDKRLRRRGADAGLRAEPVPVAPDRSRSQPQPQPRQGHALPVLQSTVRMEGLAAGGRSSTETSTAGTDPAETVPWREPSAGREIFRDGRRSRRSGAGDGSVAND